MSGHSHWSSIKHKKGTADARKGKLFSKLARQLQVAAREGGGDPATNIKLQYAIEDAKAANMPKDNIERSIKKGTGELAGESLENFMYEGYGPGGVAIMAEGLSDNKNRTSHEVRNLFEKHEGNLGGTNSVAWMFERKGMFTIAESAADEDTMLNAALECGADNVELSGDVWEVTCAATDFAQVRKALREKFKLESAELTMVPKNYVTVDEATGRKNLALVEALDAHEDINQVYPNFDLPESLTAEKSG